MPLRVEPRHLTYLTRAHHQLLTDDELTDRQRLPERKAHALDRFLGATNLTDQVIDRDLRKVLHQMLGQRRPVWVGLAAARQCLRAGNIGRINVRNSRFSQDIAPEGNMAPSGWSAHQ